VTVKAIYENGVFRPVHPVDLPENCQVEFDVRIISSDGEQAGLDDVYAILAQRFRSGETDVAARVDRAD
jgi:predicted DNA-binding antitoxin AbrB/MazE fold protein